MTRFAYVNGRYRPHAAAMVHVEDRGYQFADGVYEVIAIHRGGFVDERPHLERLGRSLSELRIGWPMSPAALKLVMRELARRNRIAEGSIYVQITRGVAPRHHAFPKRRTAPALVMTARRANLPPAAALSEGVGVITIPDIRWGRCDIKSVALLPNVLGKQAAIEAGAYEAWLVNASGEVSEGTTTNAWIVTREGRVVTHPPGPRILSGVTRGRVLRLAAESQIAVDERAFTLTELKTAREAFLTSTSSQI
ncbi:MAG: D-amino-acid transaminase, partial [Pseudomonadota bacterium]